MDSTTIHDAFPAAVLFCNDRFLSAFQLPAWRPYQDSKTLVDLPLRVPPSDALARFQSLPAPLTKKIATEFLDDVFESHPDSQLIAYTPADLTPLAPRFTAGLNAPPMLAFAADLKNRWGSLCRRDNPGPSDRTSLIPLPHPFFVPGGRFREAYYWDTLWVVHGLLACDMVDSARSATRNLLSLVSKLGFVPNGARVYYLNRSQPPVLPDMVAAIAARLPDEEDQIEWLAEAVPLLDREYNAFDECRRAPAPFESLSVYRVRAQGPRPESYFEDCETAEKAAKNIAEETEAASVRKQVYADMAAGAESGWDFSSRWLKNASKLETIRTSSVVPVCLNSVLLRSADVLRGFHTRLAADYKRKGDEKRHHVHVESAARYRRRFDTRAAAMQAAMWDGKIWRDAETDTGGHTDAVSAAAFMPLWAGARLTKSEARMFVERVERSGLVQPAGVAATTAKSGQQWDFPNVWAPLVDFAVEGLRKLHATHPDVGADGIARRIARGALTAMHAAWRREGAMFEKYDATEIRGSRGGGGEYEPQDGFGWSNGTALKLMEMYAGEIAAEGWLVD